MKQEEKAKAYDEALERVKNLKSTSFEEEVVINYIFPKLKESEDERIREAIICYVDAMPDSYEFPHGIGKEDMFAYLEKKKENIEKEYVFRPLVGTDITIAAEQAIRRAKEGEHLVLAFNGMYTLVSKYDSAKGLVDEYYTYLKEHKPAEWSEEDEKMLRTIISDGIRGAGLDSKQFDWLKSLRPSWRPSKEQMEALDCVAGAFSPNNKEYKMVMHHINTLCNMLKQL